MLIIKNNKEGFPWDIAKFHRFLFVVSLLYTLCLVFIWIFVFKNGINIETDMQAIVPQNADSAVKSANARLDAQYGGLLVFAVVGSDREVVGPATMQLQQELGKHSSIKVRNAEEFYQNWKNLIELYKPFAPHLLSDEYRQLLNSGKDTVIIRQAWRRLFGFRPGSFTGSFADDPLGVFENFISTLPVMRYVSRTDSEGYIKIEIDQDVEEIARLILLEVDAGAFDINIQKALVDFMGIQQNDIKKRHPGIEIYRTGLIFHAENAAARAKKEFSLISMVSMLSVIMLFLYCFGSIRPLLLSLASLLYSFFAAATISIWIYSGLHLLTLVFGASLIGVAIDYSLHYFSHAAGNGNYAADNLTGLKRIFPSICMGLLTTVAGYSCLYQASLPVLREIATFCITGLISAWLFVVSICPLFRSSPSFAFPALVYRVAELPIRIWNRTGTKSGVWVVLSILICGSVFWYTMGKAQNDVRLLYVPAEHLLRQDSKIRSLVSEQASNQYFLIKADSEQQLLEREERFTANLEQLMETGAIDNFSAISRYIPSVATQSQDFKLLNRSIYHQGAGLDQFLSDAGIEDELGSRFRQTRNASESHFLLPSDYLSRAPEEARIMWIGKINSHYYSLITLSGVHSVKALTEIADSDKGITFIDRVGSLSKLLNQQYRQAVYLLLVAYLFAGVVLFLRYRKLHALAIVFVPLVSTVSILVLLTAFSVSIGLFHVLAFYLSLGLGLDYGIFLYDAGGNKETAVAVILSALTSCLSFGMLSLSSTPMISALGLTILLCSLVSVIFAPLLVKYAGEKDRQTFQRP